MKVLVIYDSVFGNTEMIARAIAEGLDSHACVEIFRADPGVIERVIEADLIIVGSPTRGFRPTEAVTRLLKQIQSSLHRGVHVAAFDTRFNVEKIKSAGLRLLVKTVGYAAKRIADQLKKAGGNLIVPPEGFFVEDTEGPLKAGELERAKSLLDAHESDQLRS
jgi:flavodoxin